MSRENNLDLIDDVAARLWQAEAIDVGAPKSVADGRTRAAFDTESEDTKARWRKFARVAMSAAGGMPVAPISPSEVEQIIVSTEPVDMSDSGDQRWTMRMAFALADRFAQLATGSNSDMEELIRGLEHSDAVHSTAWRDAEKRILAYQQAISEILPLLDTIKADADPRVVRRVDEIEARLALVFSSRQDGYVASEDALLSDDRLQEIDNDACDRLANPDRYGWAPDITASELRSLISEVRESRAALEDEVRPSPARR